MDYLMDEARVTLPIVFRQRLGESQMPFEILMLGLEAIEILDVESRRGNGRRTRR